ncbi:MAG: hypothetical protein EOP14_01200 [Pseudomonas sp.]|nr:MAG: hypothetical protein EOP14_01200 [Pseudomonas sp.]
MVNFFEIEFSHFGRDGSLTTRCGKKGSYDRSDHVNDHEALCNNTASPPNTAVTTGLTDGGDGASMFDFTLSLTC